MQNYSKVLAHLKEDQAEELALTVLEYYPASQIKILSGPQQGLVMLRMQETVADSQFNAGEVLVTEVRLELDGQFGFGMTMGQRPRQAMALALVDAARRKGGPLAAQLDERLDELARQLQADRQKEYDLVAATKVDFETM